MTPNPTRTAIVGMSFHEDPPAGLGRSTAEDKHCCFVGMAREKPPFYVPAQNISCPLARFHLGIDKPDIRDLAKTLVRWSDALNEQIGAEFLTTAYRLDRPYNYIAYFGHPTSGLRADVVITICNARGAQRMVQRYSSATGERVNSPVSGIGAACGGCTAYVLQKQTPTVSVGCNGSRPGLNLTEDQLLLAAPSDSLMAKLMMGG